MTNHQSLLLLCPDLYTSQIIKQDQTKPLVFYCYAPSQSYDKIELWSNLSPQKQWTSFPFTKLQHDNEDAMVYRLLVNVSHLQVDNYEFTLRYTTTSTNDEWQWYGSPDQNGKICIVPNSRTTVAVPNFEETVPQLRLIHHHHATAVDLKHFRTQQLHTTSNGCFSLGAIPHQIHSYVAIVRKGSCWLTPLAGKSNFEKRCSQEKWQVLLYQDAENGHLFLWMAIGQKIDCWLSPSSGSSGSNNLVDFHYDTTFSKKEEDTAHLIVRSTSDTRNYNELIKTALDYYESHIKKDNNEHIDSVVEDSNSIMLDKLGYCTWNAFGKDVNAAKLDDALGSLYSEHIPIGYLILDDGWQKISQDKQQLVSLDACDEKFPCGLQQTISRLKSKYPFVQSIGVWHALWGYWNGIDETFTKINQYGDTYQLKDNKDNTISILKNPRKFYHGFYHFLRQSGVDFVKVDNQGGFQDIKRTTENEKHGLIMDLWCDEYRQIMSANADEFFDGGVVHSMALTPHILFDPQLTGQKKGKAAIFRNSDDFFPDEKDSHSWHIYANAINSLWSTHHSDIIGDWDMFQSDHPFAEYHASSRAISGGPIYITDPPNKHNTALIHKLVAQTRHDGYIILRSGQAPQSTFETIFGNPMETGSLLSLYNLHREEEEEQTSTTASKTRSMDEYRVCGFWNTGPEDKLGIITSDLFCFSSKGPFVAYIVSGPDQGKSVYLDPLSEEDTMCVRVKGFGCSTVSLSPVRSLDTVSIAYLGLTDKFNGTRAILKTSLTKLGTKKDTYDAIYEAHLTCRSSACGFWIKKTSSGRKQQQYSMVPKKVILDNQVLKLDVNWTWDPKSGLLMVNMMAVALNTTDSVHFCIQIFFK